MADLPVFVPCDRCGPYTRSAEIWVKKFDGNIWPLSWCPHHADQYAVALQRQGFNPLESEALTK